ncbi:DUF6095 family protein [Wenyingzhuangia sp. IMCC45533]
MNTKKQILNKGIKILAATLPLLFLSPVVINIGYKAAQKADIHIILYIGFALAILTIALFFWGIKTLLDYLFYK